MRRSILSFVALFTLLSTYGQARLELDYNQDKIVPTVGYGPIEFQGKLYFSADNGFHGLELFEYDPISQKSRLIKDLNPGGGSSNPVGFVQADDALYFVRNYDYNWFGGDQIMKYDPVLDSISVAVLPDSIATNTFYLFPELSHNDNLVFSTTHPFRQISEYIKAWHIYDATTETYTPMRERSTGFIFEFMPNGKHVKIGSDLYYFLWTSVVYQPKTRIYKCNLSDGLLDLVQEIPGRIESAETLGSQAYAKTSEGFFTLDPVTQLFQPSAKTFLASSEVHGSLAYSFNFFRITRFNLDTQDSITIVQFNSPEIVLNPGTRNRIGNDVYIVNYRGGIVKFNLEDESITLIDDFPSNSSIASSRVPKGTFNNHFLFIEPILSHSTTNTYANLYLFDTLTRVSTIISPKSFGNGSSSIKQIGEVNGEIAVLMSDALVLSQQQKLKTGLIYDKTVMNPDFTSNFNNLCGNTGYVLSTTNLKHNTFHLFHLPTGAMQEVTTPDSLPYRMYAHGYVYLANKTNFFTTRYHIVTGQLEQLSAQQQFKTSDVVTATNNYLAIKKNGAILYLDQNLNLQFSISVAGVLISSTTDYHIFQENNTKLSILDLNTGSNTEIPFLAQGEYIFQGYGNSDAIYLSTRDYYTHKIFFIDRNDPNFTPNIIAVDSFTNWYGGYGNLIEMNGRVYFTGKTSTKGEEWYRVNPDLTVTQVTDINDGSGSADISHIRLINNRIYFSANDGYHGREVWSLGDCFYADLIPTNTSLNMPTGEVLIEITGGQAPFTYAWSNGATSASIGNLKSGIYLVTITDANNCEATLHTFVESDQMFFQLSADKNSAVAFPNPCNDWVSIYLEKEPYQATYQVKIINSGGVIQLEKILTGSAFATVPTNQLQHGIYFVSISDLATGKVVANTQFYKH
jgi:ELWxxDGT repeat protein